MHRRLHVQFSWGQSDWMGPCCDGPTCRSQCQIDIWKAAQDGLYDEARELIAADPSCVNKPGPIDYVPPLHWAALNGHTELCRLLLGEGAMINQLGGDQWSTALHWAACRGQISAMTLLLQKGADYMTLRDQQGYLPIHIAAQHGQTFALLYLIAASRQSIIDCTDLHGRTALIWAAYRGHDEAVKVLLEEGSQVNIKDRSGNTALHWATIKGCAQVIKLLLEAGADPFDTDGEGKSSIDYAKEKRWPWFDKILSSAGHSVGSRVSSATVDVESGGLLPVKSRWLPQRLFRPIFDERTLKMLFGRILPPFVIVGCLYIGAYAINPIIGLVLIMTIAFGCRSLFLLLLPSSPPQDPKVPFLNTFHHTIDTIGVIITIAVFLPSKTSSVALCWSVVVLDIAATYLLIKAQTLDPGRIGKPKSDDERRNTVHQLAEKDQLSRRSFCLTCRAAKPMRSKHCKICGICVARFDHHCPWTNNCIGAGNHRAFVIYLICCFAAAFAFTKASVAYLGSVMTPYETSTINPWLLGKCVDVAYWIRSAYSSAPFVFLLTYIIGGGAFGVGLLTAFQLVCISRNRTTNENANQWRLEYLKEKPAELGDSGVLGNCIGFWSGKQNQLWYNLHEASHDCCLAAPQGSPGYHKISPQDTIVINVIPAKQPEERTPHNISVQNTPEPNVI